jgi:hypothetical protein
LEHNWNSTSKTNTQEYKVEKTIKHSGYSNINYNNDIALIKLANPIEFRDSMRPVCLPDRGDFSLRQEIVAPITRYRSWDLAIFKPDRMVDFASIND